METAIIGYIVFSISMAFISWVVGMMLNEVIKKRPFYSDLSHFNFIKSENLNKIIGLGYFKWIVKNTFFKFFNQKIKVKNKTTDLGVLRKEMTLSELSHLIGFIFVSGVALYKTFLDNYVFGLTLMFVNTLMNLYPSLLQQENKRRIDKLISKNHNN